MDFFFIELPKFNVSPQALRTVTEKWIYFIKEAENLSVIPEDVDDEGLLEAYQYANIQTWSKSELEDYEKDAKLQRDERGKLDYALAQGEKSVKKSVKKSASRKIKSKSQKR